MEEKIICSICDAEILPDSEGFLEYFILRDGRICCNSRHCMATVAKLKTCPTCQAEVTVIIVNVQTGGEHCHACIGPTFKPHLVYTEDDVRALRAMGIATETEAIEEFIRLMKKETIS